MTHPTQPSESSLVRHVTKLILPLVRHSETESNHTPSISRVRRPGATCKTNSCAAPLPTISAYFSAIFATLYGLDILKCGLENFIVWSTFHNVETLNFPLICWAITPYGDTVCNGPRFSDQSKRQIYL